MAEETFFRGLLATVHDISEEEITKVITEYRIWHPYNRQTDDELRPAAINTILRRRMENKQINSR